MITSTPPTLVVVFSFVWFQYMCFFFMSQNLILCSYLPVIFLFSSPYFPCTLIFPFFPRSKTRRPTTDARFQFSVLSLKDSSPPAIISLSQSLQTYDAQFFSSILMANPNGLGRCQGRNFRHLLQSGSGLGLR